MEQSRRRFVGRSLLALAWLFATIGALYMVSLPVSSGDHWVNWRDAPPPVKVFVMLFSVSILALNALWFGLFFRDLVRGEGSQYLLSRSDEGSARISLRALQASLLRRAREMEEVIGARLAVRRPESKRLRVEVYYTTTEDRNAIKVSEALRSAVKERFEELVHPEEGFTVDFDLKIEGFVPGSAGVEPPSEEKEEEPFTGPRYPID
jgi:hypothetical protein